MTMQLDLFEDRQQTKFSDDSDEDCGQVVFPGRICGKCTHFSYQNGDWNTYPFGNCYLPSYLGIGFVYEEHECIATRFPKECIWENAWQERKIAEKIMETVA